MRATGAAFGLPKLAPARSDAQAVKSPKLTIVVAGGHPDDPESACGGAMARYADLGNKVISLFLTRGEAGIPGKSHERACEILKARPVFAGQIDGDTEINASRYRQFRELLEGLKPDLVFTHWPVDTHPDHRAASLLVHDAWLRLRKSFELYYFEVMTGAQTQEFDPTQYVDITGTEARKRAACYAHVSQNPDEFYADHDMMNRFRGMEAGVKYAEAFVRHRQSAIEILPG